jgi:hypothetical protein
LSWTILTIEQKEKTYQTKSPRRMKLQWMTNPKTYLQPPKNFPYPPRHIISHHNHPRDVVLQVHGNEDVVVALLLSLREKAIQMLDRLQRTARHQTRQRMPLEMVQAVEQTAVQVRTEMESIIQLRGHRMAHAEVDLEGIGMRGLESRQWPS